MVMGNVDPDYNQLLNQLYQLQGLVGWMVDSLEENPASIPDISAEFLENFKFSDFYDDIVEDLGVSDGGGDNGSEAIGRALEQSVQEIINRIDATNDNVSSKFFQLQNNFIGFADQGFRAVQLSLQDATQNIVEQFDNGLNALADGIDGALNSQFSGIQQLFINNSNRTEAIIDQRVSALSDQMNNQTSFLTNEIRNITGTGGGGEASEVIFNSAWTTGLIIDLLSILDDFRRDFNNKDMSPEIVVNVDSEGGTDSSASIGDLSSIFNLDPIAIGQLVLQIGQEVSDSEFNTLPERVGLLNSLLIDILNNNIQSYDEFISRLDDIHGGGGMMDIFLKLLLFIPTIVRGLLSATTPFVNNIETLARTVALDGLLSRAEIAELWIRELEPTDYLLDQFKRIGINDTLARQIIKTYTVQLNEAYLREAYLRKQITFDQYREGMFKLGYSDDDAILIEKTFFRIPPVPDLIRFAVREAYDDELAEDLQLDSGYDSIKERFEGDLERNGLDPSYGELYWRAHWQLPSPSQGYEMLHRKEIDLAELERLLRVSDYSPEWINKLINIAYSPFTRVDIRRMHKVGELTEDEVFIAYQDIGYDEDKARKLTDFTIALNTTSTEELNRDLTTSQILRAFINNIIDVNSKDTLLRNLGYNDAEINVLTQIYQANLEAEQEEDVTRDNRRRISNAVSKTYIEGALSEQSARIYLQQAGYTQSQIDQEIATLRIERNLLLQSERIQNIQQSYIEFRKSDNQTRQSLAGEGYTPIEENEALALWNTQRENRFKEPTKAELKRWFVERRIDFDECRRYFMALGYDDRITDLYMQELLEARQVSP